MARQPRARLDLLLLHCEAGSSPLPLSIFMPPIGEIELASFLAAQGFRCRVVDCRHKDFSIPWLVDYLTEHRPRWVGIDVLTDTLFTAGRLVNLVRNVAPSSRVVLGGAHVTVMAEKVLRELLPDAVVVGEGEIPCAELLAGRKISDARGIVFRRGRGVSRTPAPPLLDLDAKPAPDYRIVENLAELPYSPSITTGRGCPYRCAFCAAGILSPKVRWRGVEQIIGDIQQVLDSREFAYRYLVIADDTFTVSPQRTREFCRAIQRIGGGRDLFWYAEGRVDRLARDPELLSEMYQAGLRFLQLGIESGDERVLAAYRKEITLADAVKVAEACSRERILTHAGFIVGGPMESAETIAATTALTVKLAEAGRGFLQMRFEFLNPLPGTDVYEHPQEYGIELLDPRLYSSCNFDNCVTRTEALSREDIFAVRDRLRAETGTRLLQTIQAMDDGTRNYLNELKGRIGASHSALSMLDARLLERGLGPQLEVIRRKADLFPQFLTEPGQGWRDAIPARLPFFTLAEDGAYITGLGQKLEAIEGELFHYASGKLTAAEIQMILDISDEQMSQALAGLNEKKAIVYRTY